MKSTTIGLILLGILLYLPGCDQFSTQSDETSQSEIEAALLVLIEQDSAASIEGLFDDGTFAPEYDYDNGLLTKAVSVQDTFPNDFGIIRFGRFLTGNFDRQVHFEVTDDTAFATIRMTVDGEFRVVFIDTTDTTGNEPEPVVKPFTSTSLQRIKFLRVRHTRNPRLNWRMVAVSPMLIYTQENPISLTGISVSGNGDTFDGLDISIEDSSSILNYLLDRENLPVFHRGDSVNVELSVDNPDPFFYDPGELCMMHYGIRRYHFKFRRRLFDPENDDTFVGTWRVHRPVPRMCRVIFDVIDYASIYDTEAPFSSVGIGFPYRVRR